MRMTRLRFVEMTSGHRGAEFISALAACVPPMIKTGNPYYGEVEQIIRVNGVINWSYEDSVNRQRVREGLEPDFSAYPRIWGQRIPASPWVMHKDNLYLEVKVESVNELWYRYSATHKIIEEKLLFNFIRAKAEESARQELSNPVILRDFRLDHLITIRYRGLTLILV